MPPLQNTNDTVLHSYQLDMSNAIKIEKRVVTDLISLFGDIGGLNDFLATFIIVLIGSVQTKLFTMDIVSTMFRVI